MNKPFFNNARGSASSLQLVPPFAFKDMTVSVFPIRASLPQLHSFCDRYLNMDSETVRFEPFIPYVYLMLLDYGKMSIEAANMGWVSQCEVAFSVPLRWMVRKNGAWEFHDWAINCPFIYVDNELSMSTGREVYGWPKVLARIDPTISDWVSNPHGVRQVFEVQAKVGGKTNQAKFRPLVSVHHKSIPNFMDTPPNLSGLLDPLTRAPNIATNFAKMGLDLMSSFSGMAMQGMTVSTETVKPFSADLWSGGGRDLVSSLFPRMYMNTVNFKQFRDASSPSMACYQAITNSKMEYDSIKGSGPLGQQNLLLGQIDGGYRIDIHRHASQPVVDALGLEIEESHNDSGVEIASLRPDCPFWLKVDMSYSRGKTIVWRSRDSVWKPGEGFADLPGKEDKSTAHTPDSPDSHTEEKEFSDAPAVNNTEQTAKNSEGNLYNTARGAAVQAKNGPYSLPNTTIRVLPLIADEAKLKLFASSYLNVEGKTRFEAWGSHVYLIAYNYKKSSSNDEVNLFSSREVNFSVPVKQYDWYEDGDYDLGSEEGRKLRDSEKFVSAALVTPFAYVDDASVSINSSEVHGVPTLRSDVASPTHTWMDTSGPMAGQNLLKTSALVLPEIGIGAGASQESFLSVRTDDILPLADEAGWRKIINSWCPLLIADLRRKYKERGYRKEQWSESYSFRIMRSLALQVLTGKLNINRVSLKQFRDAWETDKACYQGLVQGSKKIDRLHELHEIEETLNVWITKYPTQPVSEILGLCPKYTSPDKKVEVFEAIRPFWLRADITEELGKTLFERLPDQDWTVQEEFDKPTDRPIMAQTSTLNHIDRVYVPDLNALLNAKQDSASVTVRSNADLGEDVGAVSPATILDSILSRQWGRPESHRNKHHKSDYGVNTNSLGRQFKEQFFPACERLKNFWPLSDDDQVSAENQRKGITWQLWDNVWELIDIESVWTSTNMERNWRKRDTGYDSYRDKAIELLPDYFYSDSTEKPGSWDSKKWLEISNSLENLVAWSHHKVEWNTVIRPLDNWQKIAHEMHIQLSIDPKPDASGLTTKDRQPNVARVLSDRLDEIATK